jgi:transmembrane 9 superfamily protein 2/4
MAASLAVVAAVVAALGAAAPVAAWLPGLKPRNYVTGQRVPLRMHEMRAPSQPGVTRNYYELPGVCAPASTASEYENFGEALSGGLSQDSVIVLRLGHDVPCTPLCVRTLSSDDVRTWHARIEDGYRMQMSADGLPIVQQSLYHGADAEQITRYDMGVPLGYMRPRGMATEFAFNGSDEAYAYVHLDLRVQYHLADDGEYAGARIVGFFATPRALPCGVAGASSASPLEAGNVTWTYSVRWQSVERTWGARFDVYALPDMSASSASVHVSSIGIGLAAMLLLFVGAYSTLSVRVRRDLARYRRVKGEAVEPDDETGWKSVAGDVFRPPRARELLCAIVGTGVQLAVMAALTLAFGELLCNSHPA